jgi:hypothetical protein
MRGLFFATLYYFLIFSCNEALEVIFYDPEKLVYKSQNTSFFSDINAAFDYISSNPNPLLLKVASSSSNAIILNSVITSTTSLTIEGMLPSEKITINFKNNCQLRVQPSTSLSIKNITLVKYDSSENKDGLIFLGSDSQLILEVKRGSKKLINL